MNHKDSGVKISNPEELYLALESKIDKVNISMDARTDTLVVANLTETETKNKGNWKVPSQKAFLTFYIDVEGHKMDYSNLIGNYKTDSPNLINPYRKSSKLLDTELPFSVQGAKDFYADIKDDLDTKYDDLNTRKVNYIDAIGTVDYYTGTAWSPPVDAGVTRRYLHHKGAFDMFKVLYEDKIPYLTISDVYTDGAADEAAVILNTVKDPKRNAQLSKIASELSVRKLFVNIRNRINDEVNTINQKLADIWSFVNKKERIIDLTTIAFAKDTDKAITPKANLFVNSSYLITFFYEPNATESNMEMFRFMLGKTKDNVLFSKVFNLSKMNSNDNEFHIELVYDDAQGLVFQTKGFDKAADKLFKIKILLELENGNFK